MTIFERSGAYFGTNQKIAILASGPGVRDFALAAVIGFAGGFLVLSLGLLARFQWRPRTDPRYHRRFFALLGLSFATGAIVVAATLVWAPRTIAVLPFGAGQVATGLVVFPVIFVRASGFPFTELVARWVRRALRR